MSKFSTAGAAIAVAAGLSGFGLRETTVFDDEGNDGLYETVKTDLNAGKHWDLVIYDRDGNGRAEFATHDQGDDGDFEWILEDQDADGVYEKAPFPTLATRRPRRHRER